MDALHAEVLEMIKRGERDILEKVLGPLETLVVELVVKQCNDNYVEAARRLGISRMTLRRKLGYTRQWPFKPKFLRPSE